MNIPATLRTPLPPVHQPVVLHHACQRRTLAVAACSQVETTRFNEIYARKDERTPLVDFLLLAASKAKAIYSQAYAELARQVGRGCGCRAAAGNERGCFSGGDGEVCSRLQEGRERGMLWSGRSGSCQRQAWPLRDGSSVVSAAPFSRAAGDPPLRGAGAAHGRRLDRLRRHARQVGGAPTQGSHAPLLVGCLPGLECACTWF